MELLAPLNDASFAAQTTTYTGTAGSVTGWVYGPDGVLVTCSTDAYVRVGSGVTATTADTFCPAGVPIPFKVPSPEYGSGGSLWRVSAIQVSAGGSVYAKPINKE